MLHRARGHKRGAASYLPRPFTNAQVRHVIEQAAGQRSLRRRLAELEETLAETVPEADLLTTSPKMRALSCGAAF